MSSDGGPGPAGPGPTGILRVHLRRTPLRLYARWSQYNNELLREIALVAVGQLQPGHAHLPSALAEVIYQLHGRYAEALASPDRTRAEAATAGSLSADLVFDVPTTVGADARQLGQTFENVYACCQRGELITLPAGPEVLAFQRWFVGEFIRQAAGEAPLPWAGPLD